MFTLPSSVFTLPSRHMGGRVRNVPKQARADAGDHGRALGPRQSAERRRIPQAVKKRRNEMEHNLNKKSSALALVPFLIFVVIYLGAGLILQAQGVEMAFYQFPSVTAMLHRRARIRKRQRACIEVL